MLPHELELDRMCFVKGVMRHTDDAFRQIRATIDNFNEHALRIDIDSLEEDLTVSDAVTLTESSHKSMAQVICDSLNDEQKRALFSLLKRDSVKLG